MPAAVRLPFTFDVERLRADAARAAAAGWEKHFVSANYEGEWSGVPLRTNSELVLRLYVDPSRPDKFVDTEELADCPYFAEVLASFQCPIGSARVLRLTPGTVVKEHRDPDVTMAKGEARVHIPIETNPDVEFIVGGEELHLQPGECWYVDVDQPHRLANRGLTDRVHLVIDAVANEWLRRVTSNE